MDKSKMGAMGQEIPGDDLSGDFDPLRHPAARIPLDELEAQIDADLDGTPPADTPEEDIPRQDVPEIMESPYADDLQPPVEEPAEEEPAEKIAKVPEGEEPPPKEPADEPPSTEDRLESLERKLELSKLESERQQALNDRLAAARDKQAGERGALLQQIQQLTARQPQPSELPDQEFDTPAALPSVTPTSQPDPAVRQEIDEMRRERVAHAVSQEGARFEAEISTYLNGLKNGDGKDEEYHAFVGDLQASVSRDTGDYQEELSGTNANLAAKVARSILRTAYADARIKLLQRQEQLALELKKKARSDARAKKKTASLPRSGRAAAPPRKGADPMTMPLDDLERQVDSDYGINRGAGPEII